MHSFFRAVSSFRIVAIVTGAAFCLIILQSQIYRLKAKEAIPKEFRAELDKLGRMTLENMDVPVAAILVYKGEIIGKGFNTVKKENNAGGHAEINAISDAYKIYGDAFGKLDRNTLALYSTFEPCGMCQGAIREYNIKNVYFEKNKPFLSQLKSTLKSFIYNVEKQRFNAPGLQEHLFELHPDYPEYPLKKR